VRALETCLEQIDFPACKLFTDAPVRDCHPSIEIVPIDRLSSSLDYSNFLLLKLVDYIQTSHCLVVQWDGHVLDAERWQMKFLEYDYIGASWPQFDDGYDVGNGGFSLRSRRLMEACREPEFHGGHAEDVAIGRINRRWLEERGMRFAPKALADIFSVERAGHAGASFGYHGVFNMPRAIGIDTFWKIYRELDDLRTIQHDFFTILKDVRHGQNGLRRAVKMTADRLKYVLQSKI
jgi:hypothetical protein